ncbi:LysR family transcriptional regulator [Marinobacter nanhaiticus D15-8W]|uniref:LysR family transcriptional regulator n=1 Tax=Marinobacter nanhaiticus D15-8W TaxID=626887 RepID=N6WVW7_9GAMM|nr:LysR family transcriptional regulator [Marinobacter nanhaiticus]ENO15167.1 LysR family transcriptional regulator [Marinobacter nanhaiticus D15-8W]BES69132.1 LysR family transcriptional regulator [Marinobacter nanhaiticus D15-8W]
MYDLKELEAFASVIRSGSLTASARDLNLPKSTLSRRIRQLETSLGQSLLRRESNRLIPTEAGHVFYRYCHEILALASRGQEALDELREQISGELTLRAHGAFSRGWFTRQVESFMSEHPGIRVVLQTQVTAPTQAQSEGICLWLGEMEDCGMRQELLGSLTQGIYGQPEYLARRGRPEHPQALGAHAWVDLLGTSGDGVVLQHPREGVYPLSPPASYLKVDQLTLQGDAIARGRGLGLMPHWLADLRAQAHPGTLELCLPEWHGPALPIWLVYPHGHLPRRTRAFISYLRKSVPVAWNSRWVEAIAV